MSSVTHGASRGRKITPTYSCWKAMKARCLSKTNPAYKHYGGRGITICERWISDFQNFLSDMGERPRGLSLDRYPDNDGNYEPNNCRWATQKEQTSNTRKNIYLTHNGKRQVISDWARELGVDPSVLCYRVKNGWSDADVITKPIGRWKWNKDRVFISHNGETRTVNEWAVITGIKRTTLWYRYKNNWLVKDMLGSTEQYHAEC